MIEYRINDFNPRPPRGGRLGLVGKKLLFTYFNPRPPRGGRPSAVIYLIVRWVFQSTPPARGATAQKAQQVTEYNQISIHAPREGGDYRVGG